MIALFSFVIAVLGIIVGTTVLRWSWRQRPQVKEIKVRSGRLSVEAVGVPVGVAIILGLSVPLSLCAVFRSERRSIEVVGTSAMDQIRCVMYREYIERGNDAPSFDEEHVQRSMSRAKEHFDAGRYEESRLSLRDAFEETIDVIEFASRVANNIADTLVKCGENESARPWARLAVILDHTEEAHLRTLSATIDSQ